MGAQTRLAGALVLFSDALDSNDEKVKIFFKKCQAGQNLKQEFKDEQFKKLKEVRMSCFLSFIRFQKIFWFCTVSFFSALGV